MARASSTSLARGWTTWFVWLGLLAALSATALWAQGLVALALLAVLLWAVARLPKPLLPAIQRLTESKRAERWLDRVYDSDVDRFRTLGCWLAPLLIVTVAFGSMFVPIGDHDFEHRLVGAITLTVLCGVAAVAGNFYRKAALGSTSSESGADRNGE